MNVYWKVLIVLVIGVMITACGTPAVSTPPECADNPEDMGICIQRTVIIDSVGQVFQAQSFEAPAELPEFISMSVRQMVPGFLPFSEWDWGQWYETHLDPISISAWGNPAEPCEVTGTEFTQELAYNSVTWTGVATGEVEFTGLGGSYIHFDQATLTSISINNSLAEGSCYTDLHIRADLVK